MTTGMHKYEGIQTNGSVRVGVKGKKFAEVVREGTGE